MPAAAKTVFLEVVAIDDLAARAALVAERCGGNPELLARVNALLAANDRALAGAGTETHGTAFHVNADGGPAAEPPADPPSRDQHAGTAIAGKYTLVEVIGEGGMGSVWRAKQTEPVKRFVAVKLIKAGMDSRAVLARFDAERQALALMDHPNIAKVLDGGLHDGRPYFVMELVKGVPITEYCDACKLTPRERLELFVPVCHAIQHAHQKGVIHRDIKPSNVLIALYDDKPVAKVIDFGVAKATSQRLTEQTIDTGFGGVVGTPEYMSPEQATFNNLDIDTRSDVYALGVLLYELLTGSPPFSRKDLAQKGLLEMLRVVREEEPPRPSTKLSTAAALPTLSANRGTEPKKLAGLLRSELDWLVMKALEKDRSRRYETANSFAADVLRYLSGEPVLAHPPSTTYRLRKFVRRNRTQAIALSLVLAALVAGVVGTSLGLVQANREAEAARLAKNDAIEQKRLAEEAADQERQAKVREALRADSERKAKQEAERNLAFARKGNQLLGSVFAGLDPRTIAESGRPLQDVLRENLTQAVKELEGAAIGDPLEVAAMQNTLAGSLLALGDAALALEVIQKAFDTCKTLLGPDHPSTLTAKTRLALALKESGQPAKAVSLLEEVLEKRTAAIGPDHPDTLTTMSNLAATYLRSDQFAKAMPLLEKVLERRRAVLGPGDPSTLNSMSNLAAAHEQRGQPAKAVPLLEEVLEKRKTANGPDHPNTLTAMNNLATVYLSSNQAAKAMPLLEVALERRQAVLGPDHPSTLASLNSLATAYVTNRQYAKAVPLLEEVLKARQAKLGPDHPSTLETRNNLAFAHRQSGQPAKAVLPQEETVAKLKAKLGPGHPETLAAMGVLATVYLTNGQPDKAIPLLEETLAAMKTNLGTDHPHTIASRGNLAAAYQRSGQLARAVPLFEEALELFRAKLGPDHPSTHTTMGHLGKAYVEAGQGEKAAETLTAFVNAMRKRAPKDSPGFARMLAQVSVDLLDCGQHAAAEQLLRESLAIREKAQPDAWDTFNTYSLLGAALLGQKKYADAEPVLLKGFEGMKQREKAAPKGVETRIPDTLDRLIELYAATNKPDEAKKWRAERAKYPTVAPPPRAGR